MDEWIWRHPIGDDITMQLVCIYPVITPYMLRTLIWNGLSVLVLAT